MPPEPTEADQWRKEAQEALSQVTRVMDFFLFATSSLVRLTEIHKPNVYSHCEVDEQPWPCQTMTIVQEIGQRFTDLQRRIGNG